MKYKVQISQTAIEYLMSLDPLAQRTIVAKIDGLSVWPENQGRPLNGALSAYRSLVADVRHRIIFQVNENEVLVFIVAAIVQKNGKLETVHETLKRYIKLGLIQVGAGVSKK